LARLCPGWRGLPLFFGNFLRPPHAVGAQKP
jgi:hypothetical protein